MKKIINWILGIHTIPEFKFKERHNEPPPPGFTEWCKEFRIGCLYNKESFFKH